MSIINSITTGSGGNWSVAPNTSATASAIQFSVFHAPTDWAIARITDLTNSTTTPQICYICKLNGTYYEWSIYKNTYSGPFIRQGGTPTASYSNGTFTVTAGSNSFTTTVGDYVLIYI